MDSTITWVFIPLWVWLYLSEAAVSSDRLSSQSKPLQDQEISLKPNKHVLMSLSVILRLLDGNHHDMCASFSSQAAAFPTTSAALPLLYRWSVFEVTHFMQMPKKQ